MCLCQSPTHVIIFNYVIFLIITSVDASQLVSCLVFVEVIHIFLVDPNVGVLDISRNLN